MSNSKTMKIENGSGNFMAHLSGFILSDLKVSTFEVVEEISSFEVFHYDVDVVLVFKYIKQSDNIWMLANLKDLDFPFLKLNVLCGHCLLFHDLNSDFLPCFLMNP